MAIQENRFNNSKEKDLLLEYVSVCPTISVGTDSWPSLQGYLKAKSERGELENYTPNFQGINLSATNDGNPFDLSGSDLRFLDFSGANLHRANLKDTGLYATRLARVNLSFVTGLRSKELSKAILDDESSSIAHFPGKNEIKFNPYSLPIIEKDKHNLEMFRRACRKKRKVERKILEAYQLFKKCVMDEEKSVEATLDKAKRKDLIAWLVGFDMGFFSSEFPIQREQLLKKLNCKEQTKQEKERIYSFFKKRGF